MKKLYLLLLMMCTTFISLQAQQAVSGTVIDEDGEPLTGVNVVAKGSSVGTITDLDGNYSFTVPEGTNQLSFSYIGFLVQSIDVGAGLNNITLIEDVVGLDQVVVTALGISREKKSLGYSTQELSVDELDKVREANVINSLKGKVAGVQITGSSNIGGSSRFVIRGSNSIDGNNQPLIVIDGVPLDNSNFTSTDQARGAGGYDYGNAAQDINPDDIATMNILKGPSAAALYGSRASNGVVMITTKGGSYGKKGLGVSVNSGLTFNTVTDHYLPDYQNSYGGGSGSSSMRPQGYDDDSGFYKIPYDVLDDDGNVTASYQSFDLMADYGYDGSWGPAFDSDAAEYLGGLGESYNFSDLSSVSGQGLNYRPWYSLHDYDGDEDFGKSVPWQAAPDNIKNFFRTGITANNSVSLTGGDDKTRFRLSYTNLRQRGTQDNSTLKRHNFSFSGGAKLSDKLEVSASGNYVKSEGEGRPYTGYGESVMSQFNQWYQRQVDTEKLRNYENPDGTIRTWNPNSSTDLAAHYWDNPFWETYNNVQDDSRDRIYGNIGATYSLLDWLSVSGKVMSDFYTDKRRERIAVGGVRESGYSEDVRTVNETNLEVMLRANKDITEDISLSAYVGGNRRYNKYDRNYAGTLGGLAAPNFYSTENSVDGIDPVDFSTDKRVNSLFASASFGYKRFAYLDITARNDWSSTLPSENNSYFYPSVGGSLIFTELIGENNVLSFGKLRASWAQVGNDTDPYRVDDTYIVNPSFAGNPLATLPNAQNNATLKPEITTAFEIGTTLNFFNNRASVDLTYYTGNTKDQIFEVSTSATTGYSSRIINAGKVKNNGIEVMLGFTPIKNKAKDLTWDVNLNFAKNNNELVELPDGTDKIVLTSLFGVSYEARVGEKVGTMYGTNYVYDDSGNKLVGSDGTYLLSDGLEALGSTQADFTGGVSTALNFKGITASVLVDFQKGGVVHSLTNQWGKYSGILAETAEGNIREDGIVVSGMAAAYNEDGSLSTDADGNVLSSGQANEVTIGAQNHFFSNQGYVLNAADVYDASFVKLREISVGYQVPGKLLKKLPFTGMAISLVSRNLAILMKNVPNIDPESAVSSGNVQGFEGGQLPTERSIGFNVKLSF